MANELTGITMLETDPSRPPDWRWQEAVRLAADNTAYSPGPTDPLIHRTVSFLKNQRQAQTSRARARLQEKCPTIAAVLRIRSDPCDGRRNAIEVRLLAGYPPARVAALSALVPAVVWTYLALFFDVFDRLDADDFVCTTVIGLQCHSAGEPELDARIAAGSSRPSLGKVREASADQD